MNILERRDATQRTMDRFVGRPFAWGKYDCGKMLISHLREMNHRPTIGVGGTWCTPLGLKRFLARKGGSGAACLDGWGLPRIAPAEAWIGDVIEMPGEPPFGAFGVSIGNGRALAYYEEAEGAAVIQPLQFIAAWRL